MKTITFPLVVLLFFLSTYGYAQCNLTETITICDMTQVDYDSNGIPDGIINLYEEYTNLTGNTIQAGTWFDPGFNFALNPSTGDLYLWDLDNASETTTDYQFILTNSNCTSDAALIINVVLGPFSGFAVPTAGGNDVNVEICDLGIDPCGSSTNFDLYQTLLSVPSAHANGIWTYEGSSPNFIGINGSIFLADIPYQPGAPLVDEETFELVYTVPGIEPCSPSVETRVKVSVIREVFAGAANELNICETELISGNIGVIDLRDDAYLVNEDIEGIWLFEDDPTGQLTGPGDSIIDLGAIYNDLYQSNQRFGCETYEFSYFVESRSAVCGDKTSTVRFTFFEYLRPFSQEDPAPEFCVDDPNLSTFSLYSLLDFTTENGVLYNYPNNSCTNWNLVSGPSTLGLVSNTLGGFCQPSPLYTSQGTINLSNLTNADAGTYTFQYTVLPEYNCPLFDDEIIHTAPDGCTNSQNALHPCQSETAQVTIIIHPRNYVGENTGVLEFCETSLTSPVDLISLLITNGVDGPVYEGPLGNWFDLDSGNVITNPFTIPNIDDQQTFNFVYSTTTENNCLDRANLTFTVYEQYQSGTDATISVCNDNDVFNLFDELGGTPNTNGTWTGPNGFTSASNVVNFDPSTFDAGDYVYTVPDNGNGTDVLCPGNQATITVNITQNLTAGSDMQATTCRSGLHVDLITLLDPMADAGGTFVDLDATNALTGSMVDVSILNAGTYNFQYQIQGDPLCSVSTALIMLTVLEADTPSGQNQSFCLLDAAKISDLQIDSSGFDVYWYDTISSTDELPLEQLLINGGDYYASVIDSNGCESDRVQIVVTLLPLNDPSCDDCVINDGISDNDDGENEVLDLCNLPEVFPDFEIEIFNRYGTIVFKGNRNTPLFDGSSNVSLTIGDRLPSGFYFYVFNPNDGNTAPFQGSVYLSR